MSLDGHKKPCAITGVILAGGKSRRMGANKALLALGEDSLIGHVIRRTRLVTDELLLITNTPDEYAHLDMRMHADIVPNTGALGGVYTGLMSASHETVLCVACDSPFLEPKLLTYLVSVLGEYDAVMPYTYNGMRVRNPSDPDETRITLQTLCAAYSKRCLPIIESMLQESELRVHALQERANIKCIAPEVWQKFDPEGMSFFNINTPEDLDRASAYLKLQTILSKPLILSPRSTIFSIACLRIALKIRGKIRLFSIFFRLCTLLTHKLCL